MKECKYRLPCNWCDKLNKYCDMIEPIKIELPDANKYKCDHYWMYDKRITNTGGINDYYHCAKCGAIRLEAYDYNGNKICYESSDEWQT